ncbi:TrkH-domain-containing protein [Atractiella rhizophila]|nr:TrkH-domain-containing protein [Atractiella rhizophila]
MVAAPSPVQATRPLPSNQPPKRRSSSLLVARHGTTGTHNTHPGISHQGLGFARTITGGTHGGVKRKGVLGFWDACLKHLNFYRVHLIAFTITPLLAATIFYLVDTERKWDFVDCLFMCVSAVTVTGLTTIELSLITRVQQAILYVLMGLGSTSGVSIVFIIIRRNYFRRRFAHIIQSNAVIRKRIVDLEIAEDIQRSRKPWYKRPFQVNSHHPSPASSSAASSASEANGGRRKQLKKDLIRKLDIPVLVNRMNVGGVLSEMQTDAEEKQDEKRKAEGEAVEVGTSDGSEKEKRESGENESGEKKLEKRSLHPSRTLSIQIAEEPKGLQLDFPRSSPVAQHLSSFLDSPRAQIPHESPEALTDSPKILFHPALHSPHEHDHLPTPSRRRTNSDPLLRASSLHPSISISQLHPLHPKVGPDAETLRFLRTRTVAADGEDEIEDHISELQPNLVGRMGRRGLGGVGGVEGGRGMPRTQTVEFSLPQRPLGGGGLRQRHFTGAGAGAGTGPRRNSTLPPASNVGQVGSTGRRPSVSTGGLERNYTLSHDPNSAMHRDFGGFPNPVIAAVGFVHRHVIPKTVERKLTMPKTTTLLSAANGEIGTHVQLPNGETKEVNYISFDALVGRNSKFYDLTDEQEEELGGVEYRALSVLLKIVACYWIGCQLLSVVIVAPYFSAASQYADVFKANRVNAVWFTFFQTSTAFTNCGMSLVDTSLTQFQEAYPLLIMTIFLILAGNTAFPIFLRLTIWTLSKLFRKGTKNRETLQFLLEHPRRCFIYLFPAHQTYFLIFVLFVLNCTDWIAFLVLDLGNPVIEDIPVGPRILDGLVQASAVRSAGFNIINLGASAPALQVLYVIMMYIAVYPIALSIRATNVYEEKSMGVYHEEENETTYEANFYQRPGKATSYIAHHARKQLSFDLWWLFAALWLIAIVERDEIEDPTSNQYFNLFTIMFDLISAYGTVGLSLGLPFRNTSLAGAFRPLSKLILCAVMIRGRHRGLPVAVDRAVVLPWELEHRGVTSNDDMPATNSFTAVNTAVSNLDEEPPSEEPHGLSAEPMTRLSTVEEAISPRTTRTSPPNSPFPSPSPMKTKQA